MTSKRSVVQPARVPVVVVIACVGALVPGAVAAHGLVGKRFFPATLTTEDPFVADELSLPTISTIRTPASGEDTPGARSTEVSPSLSTIVVLERVGRPMPSCPVNASGRR